jgi:hypothetical protein
MGRPHDTLLGNKTSLTGRFKGDEMNDLTETDEATPPCAVAVLEIEDHLVVLQYLSHVGAD